MLWTGMLFLDSSVQFPIPTYIVPKDDVISEELLTQLKSLPNVHVILGVEYIQFKELSVCLKVKADDMML